MNWASRGGALVGYFNTKKILCAAGALKNFCARRNLPRDKKSFDQLALAAHQGLRETLEPLALGHFWVGIHPSQHQHELPPRNLPLLDSFEQVRVQTRRQILTAYLRHESLAIKSAGHGGLQTNDFGWILGIGQAIRQFA